MEASDTQPALVRIVEWEEWLPGKFHVVGEVQHPQTQQMIKKQIALHEGITGFKVGTRELLTDLSVTGSGESKTLQFLDDDGNEVIAEYGLYLFQAVLVRNATDYSDAVEKQVSVREELEGKAEEYSKEKGRDKRGDLILPGNNNVPPPPPNRAARRKR